jgi:hypothetical protein
MIARSRTLTGSRMEPNVSIVQPALTDEPATYGCAAQCGGTPKANTHNDLHI